MGTYIILAAILVIAFFAFRASVKHTKGDGGCCGGGSGTIREEKKLEEPIIGQKIVHIEGMHCENCQNSVERIVNKIEGVACVVNLKKNLAVVSYSKEVSDDQIMKAIESLDFKVISIENK